MYFPFSKKIEVLLYCYPCFCMQPHLARLNTSGCQDILMPKGDN